MDAESGLSGETIVGGAGQIEALMTQLSSPVGRKRQWARAALVEMGVVAVPALLVGLKSPSQQLRWESAKALGEIAAPPAIDGLLYAMLDEEPEIRWLASEGLAAIGWPAVEPLLHALVQQSDRTLFRLGTHFVLRTIEVRDGRGILGPVLAALEGFEPSVVAPVAAQEVLLELMNHRLLAA